MRLLALAIGFLFFIVLGCGLKFTRVASPVAMARYLEQIDAHNEKVNQLKASLDIKAAGILGKFIHEQADVIAREPHYLLWSLRSFFGPPAVVIAYNGQFLTMYDFSGQSDEIYRKTTLMDDEYFEMFDLRFDPQAFVTIMLGKIPLKRSKDVELNVDGDRLMIQGSLPNGWIFKSIYDHRQDKILESEMTNSSWALSYRVVYSNFSEISGINFPRSLLLFAKGKSRFAKFNIEITNVSLNGELVLPDVFYLEPH